MILTQYDLATDRGDKIRTYVEPLVGMMVREVARGKDYFVTAVNHVSRTMTLLRIGEGDREGVDYSQGGWMLTPQRNGEWRQAARGSTDVSSS